jgi:hypothetical protein
MSRNERVAEAKAEVERASRFWEECQAKARRAEHAWLDAVEELERAKKQAGDAA